MVVALAAVTLWAETRNCERGSGRPQFLRPTRTRPEWNDGSALKYFKLAGRGGDGARNASAPLWMIFWIHEHAVEVRLKDCGVRLIGEAVDVEVEVGETAFGLIRQLLILRKCGLYNRDLRDLMSA